MDERIVLKRAGCWRFIAALIIILGLPLLFPKSVLGADAGTQSDALKWVYEQEGKHLDYDGAYGAQCVDLIKYYYAYFGKASYAIGNGCQYVNNTLPEGWSRIQNTPDFVPQPGDIAVWGTELNKYGHVAIILSANESSFVSMDQNWPAGSACKQVSHTYSKFWGVIRPNFINSYNDPIGNLDVCSGGLGTITVTGWAFDRDSLGTCLDIHVYVGGPAGSGAPGYAIKADKSRNDVEAVYPGAGVNHGFRDIISVDRFGRQEIYIYAINVGEGAHTLLGVQTVTISNSGTYNISGTNANILYDIEASGISVSDCNEDVTGSVKIPEYINGIKVNRIARDVFTNCTQLENVYIPNGVYRIGSLCFANCTNLKSIVIPKTVIQLGTTVFEGCTSFTDIYYEGTQEEWNNIIIDQESLGKTGITIHYNYTGRYMIPETNANIVFDVETGGISVSDCNEDVTGSIRIPEYINGIRVNRIARDVFVNCTHLENVYIPNGAYRIGSLCFTNCSDLKSIVIPRTVTEIGTTIFEGCVSLKDIYYEGSQEEWNNITIDQESLGKTGITIHYNYTGSYKIPGTNASIVFNVEPDGIAIVDCNEDVTGSITIPASINGIKVNRIAREAFMNCSELVDVTIIGEPYRIGGLCFEDCKNLESVTFPVSVKQMGTTILNGCDKLTDIYYEGSEDEWKRIVIDEMELGKTGVIIHYNGERHSHNYISEITEPTCVENGYTTYICTLCGDSYTADIVNAVGHKEVVDRAVPATCLSDGWTEGRHCATCKEIIKAQESIKAIGHQFGEWGIINESNCISQGSKKRVCSVCGYIEMDEIDMNGHDWLESFMIDKMPTCTEEGSKSIHCRNCDAVKDSTVIEVLGHNYDEWKTIKYATCEQSGEKQRICLECGKIESMIIEKKNHSWNKGEVTIEPECQNTGMKTYTCVVCEDTYAEEIPALNHQYSKWEITKEPTCSEEGEQTRVCSRCGIDMTRMVEMLPHQYEKSIILPTCLETGYTLYDCTNCDYSYTGNYVEAMGHKFEDWEITKEPTCTQSGEKSRICNECRVSERVVLDMLEHQYKRTTIIPDCEEEGYILYTCIFCENTYRDTYTEATGHMIVTDEAKVADCTESGLTEGSHCSVCGAVLETQKEIPATGHSYSKWNITQKATCIEVGEKEHICTVCGEKETEILAALGHNWSDGIITEAATEKANGLKTYTCKTCGEVRTELIPAIKKEPSVDEPVKSSRTAVGTVVSDVESDGFYKFISSNEVEYQKPINKYIANIFVPDSVVLDGVTYQVTSIARNALENNKNVIVLNIGKNVKTIGANAFSGCSRLKKIKIGKGVTLIETKAFYKCTGLTKLTIPGKVTEIGKQAFYGCKKLRNIIIKTKKLTLKSVGSKAFKGIHTKAVIKVPKTRLKVYRKILKAKGAGKKVKIKK